MTKKKSNALPLSPDLLLPLAVIDLKLNVPIYASYVKGDYLVIFAYGYNLPLRWRIPPEYAVPAHANAPHVPDAPAGKEES